MSYSDYEGESDVEEGKEDEETEAPVDPLMVDMVNACKYGNFNKVKEIVEREGDSFVQRIDKEGHTFLHWAALAGNNELIEYLLDKGVPLNEHSHNDYGPRPIHWACVHGNVKTIDLFLEKGVSIDTTDLNGCTPLIVSAQYGQSLSISYLLQKGANKFHVDINGDTALHWAAFKGYPEVVFLLLNAGLSATQKDAFAQTPLHSACIKGDIQCAEMLVEHGAVIDDPDSNGKTPRVLAVGRRHRMLVKFLDNKDTSNLWDWRTIVFGPPSRNRYAVIFFLCGMLIWAYPFYFLKVIPMSLEEHYSLHLTFWIFSIFMWILFVWVKFSDPGYIKPNRQAYEDAVKMIGNPAAWGDYNDINNPMYNICHTCKTVRPVRAKHCRQCNKCVEVFDHHCPWIDNCIGIKNRVIFSIFLLVLGVCGLFSVFFIEELIREQGMDGWIFVGILLLTVFFISGFFQIAFMFNMIISNITTNEKANYHRYRHFKKEDGSYHNPFDRGMVYNCLEYWHLMKPPSIARKRKHTHIV